MFIIFGKWNKKKMYNIVYEPRVEDPVIVATFSTLNKAEAYMAKLKDKQPQTYKFCQIEEKG